MEGLTHKEKELLLKVNTEGLSAVQVRLIKTVHALLCNVLTSDEEAEYFEGSAELLKKAAELIKASQFALEHPEMSYGSQAVEFSVDSLNEALEEDKLQNFDN